MVKETHSDVDSSGLGGTGGGESENGLVVTSVWRRGEGRESQRLRFESRDIEKEQSKLTSELHSEGLASDGEGDLRGREGGKFSV